MGIMGSTTMPEETQPVETSPETPTNEAPADTGADAVALLGESDPDPAFYDRVSRLAGIAPEQPIDQTPAAETKPAAVELTEAQKARIQKLRDNDDNEVADTLEESLLETARTKAELAEVRRRSEATDAKLTRAESEALGARIHGELDKIARDNGYATHIGLGDRQTPAQRAVRTQIISEAANLIRNSKRDGHAPMTPAEALRGGAFIVTRVKATAKAPDARAAGRTLPPTGTGAPAKTFKTQAENRADQVKKAQALYQNR